MWPFFERLFLQRARAEAEARQRAEALFLARELFATPGRNAVLLFASRFERVAVVHADRAYEGRVATVGRRVFRWERELGRWRRVGSW